MKNSVVAGIEPMTSDLFLPRFEWQHSPLFLVVFGQINATPEPKVVHRQKTQKYCHSFPQTLKKVTACKGVAVCLNFFINSPGWVFDKEVVTCR